MIQKSVDNIILTLAFALFLLSGHYLYFKPFPRSFEGQVIPIATLSKAEKTVKYKGNQNFSWENAKFGLPLILGDRLYTHEESGAEITFKQGTKLYMDPFTLLKITENNNEFALDLLSGNISANLNSDSENITLLLGDRKFVLKGRKAKIKIRRSGNSAKITVLSGSVKVIERGQKEVSVNQAEISLSQDSGLNSKIKEFELNFENIPPDFIKTFPRNSLTLKVNSKVNPPYQLLLENISTERIQKIRMAGEEIILNNLSEGFYAVKALSQDLSAESPYLNFTIEYFEPPFFQVKEDTLFLQKNQRESLLTLKYDLRDFNQKLVITSNGRELYTREIPKHSSENSQREFSEILQVPLNLDENSSSIDVHLFASDESQYGYKRSIPVEKLIAPIPSKDIPDMLYPEAEESSLTLTWEGQSETSSFEVQVNGKTFTTKTPFLKLNLKEQGLTGKVLKWKVREILGSLNSPFSQEQKIAIEDQSQYIPEEGSRIYLEKPNQLVNFQWKGNLTSNEVFLFEISKDQSFAKIQEKREVQTTETSIPIGDKGEYYWRVKIQGPNGKIRFGRPVKIKVQPAPPPAPIKLKEKLKIEIKRVLQIKQGLQKIPHNMPLKAPLGLRILTSLFTTTYAQGNAQWAAKIDWPQNPLAKSYLLKIYQKAKSNTPIIEVEVPSPPYTWKNPRPGTYYWEVAIRDYWERVGDFSNRSELVLTKRELPPLNLVHPVHRRDFTFSDKSQSIAFEFQLEKGQKGKLLFSQDLDFKEPFLEVEVSTQRVSIKVEKILRERQSLEEIYWRVVPLNSDEFKESLRRKFSLKVGTKETLRENLKLAGQSFKPIDREVKGLKIYQKLGSVSYDQIGTAYNVKASGIFVHLIGLSKNFPLSKRRSLNLELEGGFGKAFNDLNYQQIKVGGSYRFGKAQGRIDSSIIWSIGLEAQQQTSFSESSANLLSPKANTLYGAVGTFEKYFTFLSPASLMIQIAGGTFLGYRGQFTNQIGSWNNSPLTMSLYFDSLNFKEGPNEITRNAFGLSWGLAY